MAILEIQQNRYTQTDQIKAIMAEHGLTYEHWGVRASSIPSDSQVLEAYDNEIKQLKKEGGYIETDLVALRPDTPNLEKICQKFVKEHYHTEDEVRFTVEGEGVFEILSQDGQNMLKLTTHPGDLIVIPAYRRHIFYLTDSKSIRCIRLFQDPKGWEAIYSEQEQADETAF